MSRISPSKLSFLLLIWNSVMCIIGVEVVMCYFLLSHKTVLAQEVN